MHCFFLFLTLFILHFSLMGQADATIPDALYNKNGNIVFENKIVDSDYKIIFKYSNGNILTKISLDTLNWQNGAITEEVYRSLFLKTQINKPNGNIYECKESRMQRELMISNLQENIDRRARGFEPIKREELINEMIFVKRDSIRMYLAAYTGEMLFTGKVPNYQSEKAFKQVKINSSIIYFSDSNWVRFIEHQNNLVGRYVLQRSIDQGKNWKNHLVTGSYVWDEDHYSFAFESPEHIYFLTFDGSYYYTMNLLESIDGGKTWSQLPFEYSTNIFDKENDPIETGTNRFDFLRNRRIGLDYKVIVDFSNAKKEVKVLNDKYFVLSKDGGKTWGELEELE